MAVGVTIADANDFPASDCKLHGQVRAGHVPSLPIERVDCHRHRILAVTVQQQPVRRQSQCDR
jgi:hypothetical protein